MQGSPDFLTTRTEDPPPMAMAMEVFGGPRLRQGKVDVSVPASQAVLLGVLAAEGSPGLSRAQLLALLWPRGSEPVLRHRLRQLIYSVHKCTGVPGLIRATEEEVSLDPALISIDMDSFREFLRSGDVESASRMLARGFLPVLRRSPTRDLERWLEERRIQLRRSIRQASTRRVNEGRSSGSWLDVVTGARALLRIDPTDEGALQTLLTALGILGLLDEARATYTTFSERALQITPSWAPSDSTARLVLRLPYLLNEYGAPSFETHQHIPFVGRDRELAILKGFLAPSRRSRFRAIGIAGTPGSGRTRLIQEALTAVAIPDSIVLRTHSNRLKPHPPLLGLAQLLDHPRIADTVRSGGEPWQRALDQFLTGFERTGQAAFPPHFAYSQPFRSLQEAVRRVITRVSADQQVILIVDDLPSCDGASLRVLNAVAQCAPLANVAIVATLPLRRPAAAHSERRAESWLAGFSHSIRIVLRPLDESSAVGLVSHMRSCARHDFEPRDVVLSAGGNPALLIEACKYWDCITQAPDAGVQDMGERLFQTLEAQVTHCSASSRRVLECLAAAQRPMSYHEISEVCGFRRARLRRELNGLLSQGLLKYNGQRVEVSYSLLLLYAQWKCSPARWRETHRMLAELTLRAKGDLSLAARHYKEAGDKASAIRCFHDSAEAAAAAGAFADAAHFLRAAHALSDSYSSRAAITVRVAEVLYRGRLLPDAGGWLRQSEETLEASGRYREAALHRVFQLDTEYSQSRIFRAEDVQPFLQICQRAERRGWHDVSAFALDRVLRLSRRCENAQLTRSLIARARILLARVEGKPERVALLNMIALEAYYGDPIVGYRAATQAVTLSQDLEDATLRASSLTRLVAVLIARGELRHELGDRTLREARSVAKRCHDLPERCHPILNHAAWLLDCAEYDAALHLLSDVRDDFEYLPEVTLKAIYLSHYGMAHLRSGSADDAIAFFSRAAGLLVDTAYHELDLHLQAGIGWAHLAQGRIKSAMAIYDTLPALPSEWWFDPCVVVGFLARFAKFMGRPREGLDLLVDTIANVRQRFPVHAVDLTTQAVSLFPQSTGWSRATDVLCDARELCRDHHLDRRLALLDHAVERARSS